MEEVHFFITREDYWHFQLFAFFRRRRVFLLLFLALIIFFSLYLVLNSPSILVFILFFLLCVVLLTGLIFSGLRRNASKAARAAEKRGTNIINISSQSVRQRNDLTDSTTSWRAFKAIQQDKYNIYFILDSTGSSILIAWVIPRHAFTSAEEAQSFFERAYGYWREQNAQLSIAH